MSSRAVRRFGALIIISGLGVLLVCGAVYSFLRGWADRPSETERTRQEVDQIIQAAKFQPGELLPTSTWLDIQFAANLCGNPLRSAMQRNNNTYSIVILGVWGTYASPIPGGTGTTVAVVEVLFPDKTRLRMEFYGSTLESCRELPPGNEF